jgi:hypothetical protein
MTLRVKLEIVPFGDEEKTYSIGQLDIFNKGYAESGHCEYGVIEIEPARNTAGLYTETVLHLRDLGAWALVNKVLDKLVLPKNSVEDLPRRTRKESK